MQRVLATGIIAYIFLPVDGAPTEDEEGDEQTHQKLSRVKQEWFAR